MTVLAAPALTPDELSRAEREGGLEFIDGELVEKNVSVESAEVGGLVLGTLVVHARRSGEGRVFDSTLGYKVFPDDPDRFRKPDCSVVGAARSAEFKRRDGFAFSPADIAVEVVSPNDLDDRVQEKVDEYLANGFAKVWVVRPRRRSITVHRIDGSVSTFRENHEITGEDVLPTFRVRVGELFLPPDPSDPDPPRVANADGDD